MNDIFYMKRVLQLAKKGIGKVSPNPLVGSLIVKNKQILSEGYHGYFGGPHAEVNAISKLHARQCHDSTLYVNLEPCCHYGKTPPCTDLIIKSKLRRIVIGTMDPNPLVQGKGIEMLKKSGIEVTTEILKDCCQSLNAPYFKYINQKKPYITLKIAQTIDGKIATDRCHSRWITSESSRRFVHRLRKENDAVLVGANTIVVDDPELTVHMVRGKSPKRIILDRSLDIPFEARVFHHPDPHNTIIVTTPKAPFKKIKRLKEMGISIWSIKNNTSGSIHFPSLWKKMIQEGIISVLVEGGKEAFTSFLRTGEVDRVIVFIAPKFFGNGLSAIGDLGIHTPDKALHFKKMNWIRKGSDMMLEGLF